MKCWDFADPFIDEPTEEEYNYEIAKIQEFIKQHPNDKVFVKMKRRVYCPRCHKQMETEFGACICHYCKVWFTDTFLYVERNGSRKTYYELNPEMEEVNKKRLSEFEYIDYTNQS